MKPTTTQQHIIRDLEDHAATINRLLDVLYQGRRNARDPRLIARLDAEIAHQASRLADVQARRDGLRQALE